MAYVYIVPQWFFGTSIALEILFALATLFVAVYSYKVARLYNQRSIMLMTAGFSFISLSYFSKAIVNLFLLQEVNSGLLALTLSGLNNIAGFGLYLYISLFLVGLLLLTYMTFKTENTDIFLLMLALSFIGVWLSADKILTFSIFSSVMLCLVSLYYGKEYYKNNNKKTLMIFLGFLGLLFSGIGFTFADSYYVNYVIAHLLELGSYILILTSIFLLIMKKK